MNLCLLKYILLNEFIDIWLALPQFNLDSKSMEDKHLTIPFGCFCSEKLLIISHRYKYYNKQTWNRGPMSRYSVPEILQKELKLHTKPERQAKPPQAQIF